MLTDPVERSISSELNGSNIFFAPRGALGPRAVNASCIYVQLTEGVKVYTLGPIGGERRTEGHIAAIDFAVCRQFGRECNPCVVHVILSQLRYVRT
jgi:hypothetical protein